MAWVVYEGGGCMADMHRTEYVIGTQNSYVRAQTSAPHLAWRKWAVCCVLFAQDSTRRQIQIHTINRDFEMGLRFFVPVWIGEVFRSPECRVHLFHFHISSVNKRRRLASFSIFHHSHPHGIITCERNFEELSYNMHESMDGLRTTWFIIHKIQWGSFFLLLSSVLKLLMPANLLFRREMTATYAAAASEVHIRTDPAEWKVLCMSNFLKRTQNLIIFIVSAPNEELDEDGSNFCK